MDLFKSVKLILKNNSINDLHENCFPGSIENKFKINKAIIDIRNSKKMIFKLSRVQFHKEWTVRFYINYFECLFLNENGRWKKFNFHLYVLKKYSKNI